MNQNDSTVASKASLPLEAVRYDKLTGLVPVVVQDKNNGRILMLAYANREALKRTFDTGYAWFWSRSRQDYWQKGATSGNLQSVEEVRIDCDGDSVIYLVDPAGPACHTGEVSCFYRTLTRHGDGTQEDAQPAGAPHDDAVYESPVPAQALTSTPSAIPSLGEAHSIGLPSTSDILSRLWQTIDERYATRPQGSYTSYLFEQGLDKAVKKFGEEAVEVVLAAKNAVEGHASEEMAAPSHGQRELMQESADLLFHLLIVWRSCKISPEDVYSVLQQRESKN